MHSLRMIAAAVFLTCTASAQWLTNKTPNVPRNADGKPNLTAPAPKMADGKPDLSGIWNPNPKYLVNLAADLKPGDVPMQPWAEAVFKERSAGLHAHEEPDANCLPQGVPKIDATPAPPASAAAYSEPRNSGGLVASGYVVARRKATVAAEITGKVVELLVEEGMVVEAGQVLARLDSMLAQTDLALAKSRAAATEAAASTDAAVAGKANKDLAALDKAIAKANADLTKWANDDTSFMGLEKPLFELKNPGLISIPLGFLGVIFGSLFMRDRRAEEMWNEVYARQNTGLLVSKSAAH